MERSKDYPEMGKIASSCEDPSGKLYSDSSAALHTDVAAFVRRGWQQLPWETGQKMAT